MSKKRIRVPVEPVDVHVMSNEAPTVETAPVVLDIVKAEHPTHREAINLSPIHAAAEKAGLQVTKGERVRGMVDDRIRRALSERGIVPKVVS